MNDTQTTDAALCILAGLIARQIPSPQQLACELYETSEHFVSNHDLASLLKRLAREVENTYHMSYPET